METSKTVVIREQEPAAPVPIPAPAPAPAPALAPAAGVAAGAGGGGLVAAVKELLKLKDRRIQASVFFFVCGASVVLHVLNCEVNPEHVLAGYGLFTIGVALGFLTLSGSDRLGRAAARVEEVLRGFFQ